MKITVLLLFIFPTLAYSQLTSYTSEFSVPNTPYKIKDVNDRNGKTRTVIKNNKELVVCKYSGDAIKLITIYNTERKTLCIKHLKTVNDTGSFKGEACYFEGLSKDNTDWYYCSQRYKNNNISEYRIQDKHYQELAVVRNGAPCPCIANCNNPDYEEPIELCDPKIRSNI